jgi:hypothetical protein
MIDGLEILEIANVVTVDALEAKRQEMVEQMRLLEAHRTKLQADIQQTQNNMLAVDGAIQVLDQLLKAVTPSAEVVPQETEDWTGNVPAPSEE